MVGSVDVVGAGVGQLAPGEAELVVRQVYDEHRDRLMGFFVRRTGDPELAEDWRMTWSCGWRVRWTGWTQGVRCGPTAPSTDPQTTEAPLGGGTGNESTDPGDDGTVVEAPETVPDAEARVTAGHDEDKDRFVITREYEVTIGTTTISGGGDQVWIDCDDFTREALCDSDH